MAQVRQFTAVIEREEDGYVALCPELDIANQGDTIEEARRNLGEALEGSSRLLAQQRSGSVYIPRCMLPTSR
jgi:predicted RNase H-like HicB family nuclease